MRTPLILASLLLAVAPARAAESCKFIKVGEAELRYTTPSLQVTIDGSINGQKVPMLFDTGASLTSIFGGYARRLDLPTQQTDEVHQGVGGSARIQSAAVKSFAVGSSRPAQNRRYRVLDDFGAPPWLAAIVGRDWMFQADLELDLGKKHVNFFLPRDCGDAHLAYWDAQAQVLPIEGDFNLYKAPLITVQVNGVPVQAMIDSGATATVISSAAGRRAGLTPDMPGARPNGRAVGIGDASVANMLVPVRSFEVGSERIEDVKINLGELSMSNGVNRVEMLLGADFLRAHRVLISGVQRKVYLSYTGGEPFQADRALRRRFIEAEAQDGNADAQYALGVDQLNNGRDAAEREAGQTLLRQAAAEGMPMAQQFLGTQAYVARDFAAAATALAGYVRFNPADLTTQILYTVALQRSGQEAAAASQLQAARSQLDNERWPMPVLSLLQGEQTLDAVLAQIDAAAVAPAARRCFTLLIAADQTRARALYERAAASCPAASTEQQAARKALAQP
ncbi:retroviral-like aspartic protease family protein [Massilia sp. TS11]|uniref:retroviral-like aspartic protease family protein n=1 Tax=Massilia sp. TS11 TaxID=2908003 RepID=UPI001EDAE4F7|nr:retroviral-like aspartic protease family protein [Massilia sp. TS11]MCG2583402.1 aspartyl protease family protein [Massilia sp. TS11]